MLLLALVALVFDANWLKGPIERAVSEKTGRAFEIQGELGIILRGHPRLRMGQVRFANPSWATEPEALRLEQAEISIALWPLLHGRIVLPEVSLVKPVVALERSADGLLNNWTFGRAEPDAPEDQRGEPPVIGRLTVDQGLLLFHDPMQKTALGLEVATVAQAADGLPGVEFRAYGRYQGQRIDGNGSGGAILSLADGTLSYPLQARFRIGATAATVAGSVTGLAAFTAAELALDLRGETLSELFPLVGVALPPTPPYRIKGRLIHEGVHWRFHDFAGRVGDSDLSGDVDVAYQDQRVRLDATLESDVLDMNDLGGFIGAPPATGPGETVSAKQAQQAAAKKASPTLLPDLPIKLDRLRAMDADVRFTGKSIRGNKRIDDLHTHLVLDQGVLRTQPLNFGIAGGNVVATLVLDGRGERARIDGDFEFKRIDLRKMFPGNRTVEKSTGLVGGRAVLKGQGNSLADFLADADGTLGLAMSGGQVSNLVLELAGLDAAEALRLLFRGDKPVQIRCAVADLGVEDGLVTAKSVIVDTTDTNLSIEGQVNLRSEEMDLTLYPLPKDYSLAVFRSPLHLRGTFKDPSVRLDKGLALRGGIAVLLGAVAGPLSALVALIETGPGDDANCEHLIAAMEQHAGKKSLRTVSPETGSP